MEYRLICTSCTDPVSNSLEIISCPRRACVTLEGPRQPEPEKVGIEIKQQALAVLEKAKTHFCPLYCRFADHCSLPAASVFLIWHAVDRPTVRIDCSHLLWATVDVATVCGCGQLLYEILSLQGTIYTVYTVYYTVLVVLTEGIHAVSERE